MRRRCCLRRPRRSAVAWGARGGPIGDAVGGGVDAGIDRCGVPGRLLGQGGERQHGLRRCRDPGAPFDGGDEAAVVGFCGAEPPGGDFGGRGAVSGVEDGVARPSGGRTATFWLGGGGTGDATGGEVGEAEVSLGSSSNAANGLVWSAASADVELLRGPWPRWAWRAALASDTTDTSHLLKGLPARLCAIPNAILYDPPLQSPGHPTRRGKSLFPKDLA